MPARSRWRQRRAAGGAGAAAAVVAGVRPAAALGAARDAPARLHVQDEALGGEVDGADDGVLQLEQVSEYTDEAHGTPEVAGGFVTSETTARSVRVFLCSSTPRVSSPARPSSPRYVEITPSEDPLNVEESQISWTSLGLGNA